jgi:hypothetical protein
MSYYEEIRELAKKVSVLIVDFSGDRDIRPLLQTYA